jgi:hypothetical protein
LQLQDRWYPIQVKQKDKVGRPDIDAFETAMRRAKRGVSTALVGLASSPACLA